MDGLTSDNLRPLSQGALELVANTAHQLKSARYAMHRVRLANYVNAMKSGAMTPDIAKQFYLAAMQNYDDMMKGSANGSFSDAIDREMADFDINEAFSG